MKLLQRIAKKSIDTLDYMKSNIDITGSLLQTSKRSKRETKDRYEKYDLEFDICCNGHSFRDLNGDANDDGLNYNKKSVMVEGYIYKKGTFEYYGYESGVKVDGKPEFLERLIGKWICKGWYINKGKEATTGHYIDSIHTYDLDSGTSLSRVLESSGKEMIDLHTPFNRMLSPGKGAYSRVKGGNVIQINVGTNKTQSLNYTFKFKFRS